MKDFSKNTTRVVIGFPNITEIRIGSALRVAITYYKILNKIYEDTIKIDKLYFLLNNLKEVYKFKTVVKYINYVLNIYLEENTETIKNIKLPVLDVINKNLGYEPVPIKMIEYLNDIILPQLIKIALINMEEERLNIYKISVNRQDYLDIYSPFLDSNDEMKIASSFCKDMYSWLEYNQILRIDNVYLTEKSGNIEIPIKFSFIEKIGGFYDG